MADVNQPDDGAYPMFDDLALGAFLRDVLHAATFPPRCDGDESPNPGRGAQQRDAEARGNGAGFLSVRRLQPCECDGEGTARSQLRAGHPRRASARVGPARS